MRNSITLVQILFIGLLLIGTIHQIPKVSAEDDYTVNFSVKLLTQVGDPVREKTVDYIRTALVPLGIEVIPRIKQFNQFAASMYGMVDSESWDLGLANWRGSQATPRFSGLYYSNHSGSAAVDTYKLNNPSWQQWQYQDTEINQTSEVDPLVWQIDNTQNVTQRKELLNQFQELFMNKLLYDIPLSIRSNFLFHWKGLVNYDPLTDPLFNIFKGAHWDESIDPERLKFADNKTINIDNGKEGFGSFDWTQQQSISMTERMFPLASALVQNTFAETIHPDLAHAWEMSDWLNNGSTIENGKYKFWIRNDAYYRRNTPNGSEEIQGGPYPVKARDFAFSLQITRMLWWFIPAWTKPWITKYEVNDTENSITYYVDKPTRDTYLGFSNTFPLPVFYLNKTLTYYNSTGDNNIFGTPFELNSLGISPFDTLEWNDYEKNLVAAGPYELIEYKADEIARYTMRDDYWFPNEWDSPNRDFSVHTEEIEKPAYFTYNTTLENPFQKPTRLTIENYNLQTIKQGKFPNFQFARLDAFKNGVIDIHDAGYFNHLVQLFVDPRFDHIEYFPNEGAEVLVVNLLNPDLQIYNVRRAIAHVINKEELKLIRDGYYYPNDSPVSLFYKDYYRDDWKIHYDCTKARDLMREEGYWAAESCEFPYGGVASPPPVTISPELGSDRILLLSSFGILVLAKLQRKRNY